MNRTVSRLSVAGLATLAVVACADTTSSTNSSLTAAALSAALGSVPVGYGELASSFIGAAASDAPAAGLWVGGGREASFDRGGLMGGGMRDEFQGGIMFEGRGGLRGPFGGPFGGGLGCNGTFDATSGRVVCPDVTRNGITIKRSTQFKDAAGNVQQAFDTLTTNSVNTQTATSGTLTFDRAADSASNRGPGGGFGGEHMWGRGRGPGGRLLGDTTTGLVIPVATSTTERPYPKAGTTTRSIAATLQYANESAVSLTRREVVTYDGTATAKVVITENGTTKNCTKPLPRGPLSCS
jgi:hypothetical protein